VTTESLTPGRDVTTPEGIAPLSDPGIQPEGIQPEGIQPEEIRARSQLEIVWRRFTRHRVGLAAAIVLFLMIAMAIVYPMVSPFDAAELTPEAQNLGPGWPHVFGTGPLGEDLFVEVWKGARTSLLVGLVAALGATALGGLIGALGGYFGRWVDAPLVLVTDVFLAVPPLAAMIAIASVTGGLSLSLIIVVIALFTWMSVARLLRAEFIALREREFVLAARAVGASPWRIMLRHMLPNSVSVIVVSATLLVALAIILEATLSFLGVGLDLITNTSWGNLLNRSQDGALLGYWWAIVFPGFAIVITALCVNFLGDALRDALDPHALEGRGQD